MAPRPDLPDLAVTGSTGGLGGMVARQLAAAGSAQRLDRPQQHFAFIDAAAAGGVQHIVYTSSYGAAPDAVFTLARAAEIITAETRRGITQQGNWQGCRRMCGPLAARTRSAWQRSFSSPNSRR